MNKETFTINPLNTTSSWTKFLSWWWKIERVCFRERKETCNKFKSQDMFLRLWIPRNRVYVSSMELFAVWTRWKQWFMWRALSIYIFFKNKVERKDIYKFGDHSSINITYLLFFTITQLFFKLRTHFYTFLKQNRSLSELFRSANKRTTTHTSGVKKWFSRKGNIQHDCWK